MPLKKITGLLVLYLICYASVAARAAESIEPELITIHLTDKDTFVTNSVLKEKDPWTALGLCVLMGPLGVHRIYLGTSVTTAIAYICTGAGFGVLWVTDTIFLIRAVVRRDASDLSGKRHFFIWNK